MWGFEQRALFRVAASAAPAAFSAALLVALRCARDEFNRLDRELRASSPAAAPAMRARLDEASDRMVALDEEVGRRLGERALENQHRRGLRR